MKQTWTNENFDRLRTVGDPSADEIIERLATDNPMSMVSDLITNLMAGETATSEKLPKLARDYLAGEDELPPEIDLERVHKGQRLFQIYGPEVLTVLCCYSLPCCYAATNGAKVLSQTGQMVTNSRQRIFTTARLMGGIMKPGALVPGGSARPLVRHVRLLHAAIRFLVIFREMNSDPNWTRDDGVPVNQEDMAGTLVSFSWVVLDGIDKLGIELTDDQRDSFQHAWGAVGHLLGVDPEVIPRTVDEAKELGYFIKGRQIDRQPARDLGTPAPGVVLTSSLLEALQEPLPGKRFDGLPATLMRFFLPEEVADQLKIPPADYTKKIVNFVSAVSGRLDRLTSRSERNTGIVAWFGRVLAESMIACETERFPAAITRQIRRSTPVLRDLRMPAPMQR